MCGVCAKEFDTRNQMFKHLKDRGHERPTQEKEAFVEVDEDFGQKRAKKKKSRK